MMKKENQKTGTKEWSDRSYNFCLGCSNDCRYCYARELAVRYKRCTAEQWPLMRIDQKKVDKPVKFERGIWMFPTSHDITDANLSEYLCVLRKIVDAGNRVLIVSKPRIDCIAAICETFEAFRSQIRMRFTIGSPDDAVLRFWEPNAPAFGERLECLEYAFDMGYVTSVSCEPFLDDAVLRTYEACRPFITDSFWIGRMNQFERRVNLAGASEADIQIFVRPMRELISDDYCRKLYLAMKNMRFVHWKDSFRDIISSMII